MQHKTIQREDAVQKDKLIVMLDEFAFFSFGFCEFNYHVAFPSGLFLNSNKAVE